MSQQHECANHVELHESAYLERHGLDCGPYEGTHEEWWECSVCGETFTQAELEDRHRTLDAAGLAELVHEEERQNNVA